MSSFLEDETEKIRGEKRPVNEDGDGSGEDETQKRKTKKGQQVGYPNRSSRGVQGRSGRENQKVASIELSIQERLAKLQAQLQGASPAASAAIAAVKQLTTPGPITAIPPAPGAGLKAALEYDKIEVKPVTTLAVNLRQQREKKLAQFKVTRPSDEKKNMKGFYDPRMGLKPSARGKRMMRFVEPGKFIRNANRIRSKLEVEEMKKEIARHQDENKSDDDEGVKLPMGEEDMPDMVNLIAMKEKRKRALDPVPDVEWWDRIVLVNKAYPAMPTQQQNGPDSSATMMEVDTDENAGIDIPVNEDKITIYVEHPIPLAAPKKNTSAAPMPLLLTQKERKKLRRQQRAEKEKEKQEMIRAGLIEPPPPKIKIKNMMQVLTSQAVADPSRVEAQVRKEMEERVKNHELRNLEAKLTPEQRKEKILKKMMDDRAKDTVVCLFRITDLASRKNEFKIDINAQQMHMSGCMVKYSGCNVVVTEGGPKAAKKYVKLLTKRIKWNASEDDDDGDESDDSDNEGKPGDGNSTGRCDLIWQGSVLKPSFSGFRIENCHSNEILVREYFKKHNVEHYWDMCVNFKPSDTFRSAE